MAKERIYPFAVASVRSMENKLLTKQKLLQMAEAKDAEEALRFLQDSDYGKTQIGDVHEFETMIQANLEEAYQAMGKLIPNEVFMDIFRFKNDYHNVKVLIKEEISKVNGRKFLIQGGSIPVEDLRKFFRERNYMEMPCIDEKAVEEAIELYAKTKNGRYIDTTLDRACFRVMSDAAEKLGIPYVATYVRKLADITNLKTLYRIYTLKRTEQELTESLVPGGEISAEALLHAFKSDNAAAALKETGYGRLCDSMELGFTAFEKAVNCRTKGVVINSPNNPSGVVYTEETLRGLAVLLERKSAEYGHPIYIIADEPYRELVYGDVTVSFIPCLYRNTIVCYSYSKSLSLPGERIGYVYVPGFADDSAAVYAAVSGAARVMGHVCPPTLMQKVIQLCAGERPDLAAYDENRNLLYNSLREMGYECAKPDGAFYLFVKAPNGDANVFSEKAKLGYNLLVVPADGFGCPGYFRLSYCVSNDMIRRSLPAFRAMMEECR